MLYSTTKPSHVDQTILLPNLALQTKLFRLLYSTTKPSPADQTPVYSPLFQSMMRTKFIHSLTQNAPSHMHSKHRVFRLGVHAKEPENTLLLSGVR